MENISLDQLYVSIGKNVARLRKEKGFSQLELSLKMDYKSVSVVSAAEICYVIKDKKGKEYKKHFNIDQLHKISQILEVDICEFFKPVEE